MTGLVAHYVGLGNDSSGAIHLQVSPTLTGCGLPLVVLGQRDTYGAHLVRSRWQGKLPDDMRLCACAVG